MNVQAQRAAELREKLKRYTEGTATHNAIVQEIANIETQMSGHAREVQRQRDHFAAHGRRAGVIAPHIQHGDRGP